MRERLQQLIDTNEFEFLKTMSEEDIWKFAFAILYVFSEREERIGHWIDIDGLWFKCSECDAHRKMFSGYKENYCSNCGCRMIEPQGSEEISDTNLKMWQEIFKAESDHKCHTCKHYTSGEHDGSCGSYICEHYSNWESEDKE